MTANTIDEALHAAYAALAAASDYAALETVRVHYLGKKGVLTKQLQSLGTMPAIERPVFGKQINIAKHTLTTAIEARRAELIAAKEAATLQDSIDVTLPGRNTVAVGRFHPVTQVQRHIEAIFAQLGFSVATGPEIETEYYNFSALNIPKNHPARALHDTFYFDDGRVLRTHTSPVQVREMENHTLPIRIIAPGKTYRCDSDVTHTPMFHQVEGLYVDTNVSLADLKGTLTAFLRTFFARDVSIRFRSSYFPFVEPGVEVDISCTLCAQAGCRTCSNSGWIEVLGAGMVHPNVLNAAGVDATQYSGFAFGMGIDRMAMLHYGIDDLRLFFENDIPFLGQFI